MKYRYVLEEFHITVSMIGLYNILDEYIEFLGRFKLNTHTTGRGLTPVMLVEVLAFKLWY